MTPSTEYCTIQLTQAQVALVCVSDFELISQYKWQARWSKGTRSFYAIREVRIEGKKKTLLMHRMILGLEFGDKRHGDHRNRNTLDNRRDNLRIATSSQNGANSSVYRNNPCGLKGAFWDKRDKVWTSAIRKNGKLKHLGRFSTPEQAHAAYCDAAQDIHGEFARFS